ncbi:secretion accessory protein EsaA/YueB [Gracilibacillus boraciitolerans JCM 21714]|uniref:Type VII secretion system accessory factor EsaA n=1 Tax=Gracilibacillus boraciitolerans JCM 21714 TaxID=1298598 RepID=W4VNU3_9BACI|nr:type VII secretion protein EsaA [Gracilibacillus boraciitolerans]GAE94503.1 secretion accessory protein EsaA/YueB [Gracilibacillus boraciitolerans JCM 21714]
MKKSFIQLPLFMALIVAMIFGLSHLSLDGGASVSENVNSPNEDRMSIALVNEDEGAVFSEAELDFGNAFVSSINQNSNHEWFVVSRGVAESGLERNTYDMMIVIPNDFTQKALSIEAETPEQVVLNYKINASDSEAIRAQAEETASSILNDFNRRIIDVYFASVIGNLQDAQDNVAQLVEEYENLTYTYNNAVNEPLSGYTTQFTAIKDNTAMSVDSFSNFENLLNSYRESLVEQFGSYEEYRSGIDDVNDTQQANYVINQAFYEQLNAFKNGLENGDVNNQLQQLQETNQFINSQFQINEDQENQMRNIAFHTNGIRNRLDQALKELEKEQAEFDVVAINTNVKERLAVIMEEAFDDEDQLTVLLSSQQDRLLAKIEDQIANLPSLDIDGLEDTELSPEIIRELQNVIKVTEKYNSEFNEVPLNNPDMILSEHIQTLKTSLNKNGVVLTDKVILPESDKPLRDFKVYDIPEGFEINRLVVQLPDEEEVVFDDYQENEMVTLPSYQNGGEFTISLSLRLKDDYLDMPINIFNIKQWKWDLYQIDEEDKGLLDLLDIFKNKQDDKETDDSVPNADSDETSSDQENSNGGDETTDQSDSPDKNNDNTDQTDNEDNPTGTEEDQDSSDGNGNDENTEGNDDEQENPEENQGENDGTPGDNEENERTPGDNEDNKGNPDENDGSDEEEEETEIELVAIDHHHIRHNVQTPLIDEVTKDLIRSVENTISPYQKLLSSYEAYFGMSLTCTDVEGDECANISDEISLVEMATDDSLYALFNKNVSELLTNYIADQVIADVLQEIKEPLANYQGQIEGHRSFVEQTNLKADQLANTITQTKESARVLNDNLQKSLEDIIEWRNQSLVLIEDQAEIQNRNDEEQTMVMALGDRYQPLLTQSQSLADAASTNLTEAETVYQTFERIDTQADTIQQSGSSIIQQADTLAENMTSKLMNDQNFAENFSTVMANSRIGERQNEDLYDFLSNPVETKNAGVIIETETFTPYFLVVITFIVALFTAYGISTINQKRSQEDQFKTEESLVGQNGLITGITAAIGGVLEGLVIGISSSTLLNIAGEKLVIWNGLMVLIMVTMVLAATYLLRQLKMLGMFLLLMVISLYLFLTGALTNSLSGVGQLRDYSPLQFVEKLLNRVIQGASDYGFIVFGLIVIALLALTANLLVVSRGSTKITEEDDKNAA